MSVLDNQASLLYSAPTDPKTANAHKSARFIRRLPELQRVSLGDSVSFECSAVSSVAWFMDGRPIDASSPPAGLRIRAFDDGLHSLVIDACQREHCGVFTARTSNEYGSESCTCNVEMEEKGADYGNFIKI